MKVRLQVNFFEHREYDVIFKENLLIFKSKTDEKKIVISDILTMDLVGTATKIHGFVLETAEKRYRGTFLLVGDSDQFITKIATESGRIVQMNRIEEETPEQSEN